MTKEIINWNETRLLLQDESIVEPLRWILRNMHGCGFDAIIHADNFRSPAEQLKKYQAGTSKVQWGYHCATRNGKPASLAADIISFEHRYFDKIQAVSKLDEKFWIYLGHFADAVGMDWGGTWFAGWSSPDAVASAKKIEQAAQSLDWQSVQWSYDFGWDPAHVEVRGVSMAEAREGWRIKDGQKFKIVT